jgi:hypothetical protein
MKKLLLYLFVLGLVGCQPPKEQKSEPNMEFGVIPFKKGLI